MLNAFSFCHFTLLLIIYGHLHCDFSTYGLHELLPTSGESVMLTEPLEIYLGTNGDVFSSYFTVFLYEMLTSRRVGALKRCFQWKVPDQSL